MAASVTARVKIDGASDAQPVAPPNATLHITFSSVPALITTRPHGQLLFQNAIASATKNATTISTSETRATTLPSSKNWRSHARYPSTRGLGFSGAGNQKRLVGKSSRVATIPQTLRLYSEEAERQEKEGPDVPAELVVVPSPHPREKVVEEFHGFSFPSSWSTLPRAGH
jgi:hypothetical protein